MAYKMEKIYADITLISPADVSSDLTSVELKRTIDAEALSQFQKFVTDSSSIFDKNNFDGELCYCDLEYDLTDEPCDEEPHDDIVHALYTAYKHNESTGDKIRCLLLIMILVDNSTEGADQHSKWKFKNVTVNDKVLNSYREAEDEIDRILSVL